MTLVSVLRKENNSISCDDLKDGEKRRIPNPVCKFEDAFKHHPDIMTNIRKVGFQKPTPIQVFLLYYLTSRKTFQLTFQQIHRNSYFSHRLGQSYFKDMISLE